MHFDLLLPYNGWLSHQVFERTFNVQRTNPERPHIFEKMRKKLKLSAIAHVEQMHGDGVVHMTQPMMPLPQVDGMITQTPGLGLLIKIADCQALFLVDPVTRTIANIHAGWRGSASKILTKTVAKMEREHGVQAKNLRVTVSPSLGPCCAVFTDPLTELPPHLHPFISKNKTVDFWAATKAECVANGIPENQIEIAGICTKCDKKEWFSHRGDPTEKTGRCAAVIGLRFLKMVL